MADGKKPAGGGRPRAGSGYPAERHISEAEAIEQFRAAMLEAGITPPEDIRADGNLHRYPTNGKRGDDSGWYVLHLDGIPAGRFGEWRLGTDETWRADIGRSLSPEEERVHRERLERMRRERADKDRRRRADAAKKATKIWGAAPDAPAEHAYLVRKAIRPHGTRVQDESLVIPVRDVDQLCSLQFIAPDGDKRFLPGGRVQGCYFAIGGTLDAAPALAIVEGFATGATVQEATGWPVAVAFNAGNLEPVAVRMRGRWPELPIIVCADDDYRTPGNPGVSAAKAAAAAAGGTVVIPVFPDPRPEGATDFNDLAAVVGPEAVRELFQAAAKQPATASRTAGGSWPEPQPLAVHVEEIPYPLDALPDGIRAAVEEVQNFVQSPLPMVAASALAVLSTAAQALADIQRAEGLEGPVSLFLLTIADSGERKSSTDGHFSKPLRAYEAEQARTLKPEIEAFEARKTAHDAEREGLVSALRAAKKKGDPTEAYRAELEEHEHRRPEPPRVPRLMLGDSTPEHMAFRLAREWPAAAVLSSEAGVIFGSHGMGKDSVMRNVSALNVYWDGGELTIGRRTSESFVVRGARLTLGLQVQAETYQSFGENTGGLARGTGFLARFLMSYPKSTQGARYFREPPKSWPRLAAYHSRIREILTQPVALDEEGALTPALLTMTPEGQREWIAFHDRIESELGAGGELGDVRDVASKTADNAARLAALFHMFEHGGGPVGVDAVEAGCRVAAWHLHEARRFFGELGAPPELADAARLDGWLIESCRRKSVDRVPVSEVQQYGPGPLRRKAALRAALDDLAELDRARLVVEGRRKYIAVNPALIAEVEG